MEFVTLARFFLVLQVEFRGHPKGRGKQWAKDPEDFIRIQRLRAQRQSQSWPQHVPDPDQILL